MACEEAEERFGIPGCEVVFKGGKLVTRITDPNIYPEVPPNPEFVEGIASKDFVLDQHPELWVRVFRPHNSELKLLPLVIYFHGGGFLTFSASSLIFHNWCHQISKTLGAIVVSVNYRLAPEHRLPAAYDDGISVLKWLADFRSSKDEDFAFADFSRVFVMGDSAGGNLTHHVAVRAAQEHKSLGFNLAGQVPIQPFFGGVSRSDSEVKLAATGPLISTEDCDRYWKFALPEGADRDHGFSNVALNLRQVLMEVNDAFAPKTLVVVGTSDLLHDRGVEYAKILEEAGNSVKLVVYENTEHAFYIQPECQETLLLLDEMKRFCIG